VICSASACAQGYPSKPIRLLVGFVADGSADGSARVIAARMGQALGTDIVVENRGGAGGSVAAQIVARAPADGYTLLWSSPGALTISPILGKNLPYDRTTKSGGLKPIRVHAPLARRSARQQPCVRVARTVLPAETSRYDMC
jgi:tripartite-type tricarboxylate transporter receptor subunit TctC